LLMKTNKTNKQTNQTHNSSSTPLWQQNQVDDYQWEILYRNEGRAGASLAHLFSLYLTNYTPPSHYPPKKFIRKNKITHHENLCPFLPEIIFKLIIFKEEFSLVKSHPLCMILTLLFKSHLQTIILIEIFQKPISLPWNPELPSLFFFSLRARLVAGNLQSETLWRFYHSTTVL
jgi:hypothetical protein